MSVRIIICGLPRLLSDTVSAILATDAGMIVVARLDDPAELMAAVEALQPDAVVLQQQAPSSASVLAALSVACPGLRIVTIGGLNGHDDPRLRDGNTLRLRGLSAAGLIRLLHGKTRRERGRAPRREA